MSTNEPLKGQVEPQINETPSEQPTDGMNTTNDVYVQAILDHQAEEKKKANQEAFQKRFGKKNKTGENTKEPKKKRIYESGITENVTHGEQVVEVIVTWPDFNPSNAALLPANLEAKNEQAWVYVTSVQDTKQARQEDITARQDVYHDLKPWSRRVANELAASGAPKKVVNDAKYYIAKIDGHRIIKLNPNETNKKKISVCQTSYTQQVNHVNGLIGVVSGCPEYDPNVPDLAVTGMEAKRDAMKASNAAFFKSNAKYSTALVKRNEFFNAEYTGYVETYGLVKRAAKATYGNSSDEYKQISGFSFTKIKTK